MLKIKPNHKVSVYANAVILSSHVPYKHLHRLISIISHRKRSRAEAVPVQVFWKHRPSSEMNERAHIPKHSFGVGEL